jgi:large subunit ribosomal protein L33
MRAYKHCVLECTEAKTEGARPSIYVTTRTKKSIRTPGRLEKVKFNPYLKRRTLHREKR